MEKPIVFLSHSSQDKAALATLKTILDKRAAGSLDFFLSSDGESIPLGRNWVVRVSDALEKAQLMFIFLSNKSANLKWIHFEAGCAYAKNIQVVPVCLPGVGLDRITPPLSLLQGFNLHSHEAMGNLARVCNEKFKMKINEDFSKQDFEDFNREIIGIELGFFGEQTRLIDEVLLNLRNPNLTPQDFCPLNSIKEICEDAGIKPHIVVNKQTPAVANQWVKEFGTLELPGCIVQYRISTNDTATNSNIGMTIFMSTELFHKNANLIDLWAIKKPMLCNLKGEIKFARRIGGESKRHRLSSKLYNHNIETVSSTSADGFIYEGFKFHLSAGLVFAQFIFNPNGKLNDERLSIVIRKLFEAPILWECTTELVQALSQ